jgi:ketosteroid isomerase-like protein
VLRYALSVQQNVFLCASAAKSVEARQILGSELKMKVSNQHSHNLVQLHRVAVLAFTLVLSLSFATTASAQKKKKNDTPSIPVPAVQTPEEQKIDTSIGEMLGAWQLGDVEKLHAHYADDVDVVNGMWAPPVVGWPNYLVSYQSQRARSQQVRLDRSNTLIRLAPSGQTAWACYQWEFSAVVDGVPTSAFGQTTLIFEKRNDAWLIVHNHTSLIQASQANSPQTPPAPASTPTKP